MTNLRRLTRELAHEYWTTKPADRPDTLLWQRGASAMERRDLRIFAICMGTHFVAFLVAILSKEVAPIGWPREVDFLLMMAGMLGMIYWSFMWVALRDRVTRRAWQTIAPTTPQAAVS